MVAVRAIVFERSRGECDENLTGVLLLVADVLPAKIPSRFVLKFLPIVTCYETAHSSVMGRKSLLCSKHGESLQRVYYSIVRADEQILYIWYFCRSKERAHSVGV